MFVAVSMADTQEREAIGSHGKDRGKMVTPEIVYAMEADEVSTAPKSGSVWTIVGCVCYAQRPYGYSANWI